MTFASHSGAPIVKERKTKVGEGREGWKVTSLRQDYNSDSSAITSAGEIFHNGKGWRHPPPSGWFWEGLEGRSPPPRTFDSPLLLSLQGLGWASTPVCLPLLPQPYGHALLWTFLTRFGVITKHSIRIISLNIFKFWANSFFMFSVCISLCFR